MILAQISRRGWRAATCLWALVIMALTSFPHPEQLVVPPPGLDKLVHAAVYIPLAFFFARWLSASKHRLGGLRWLPLIAPCLFGLLDELHQIPIPGRMFSWWDVGADCLGVLIGWGIAAALVRTGRRHE